MTSPELDQEQRRAPAWRRLALMGALAAGVHQACALNPQPIPPDELGATASDAGSRGGSSSSGGDLAPGMGTDSGASGGSSGDLFDGDAGDGGPDGDAGDADAGDASDGDAGDGDGDAG